MWVPVVRRQGFGKRNHSGGLGRAAERMPLEGSRSAGEPQSMYTSVGPAARRQAQGGILPERVKISLAQAPSMLHFYACMPTVALYIVLPYT